MPAATTTRRPGSLGLSLKVVATLLLAWIVQDLAEAPCDPLRVGPACFTAPASAPASPDACADSCKPDCFCCSSPAPAAPAFSVTAPRAAPAAAPPVRGGLVAGAPPLVDHIPIVTS